VDDIRPFDLLAEGRERAQRKRAGGDVEGGTAPVDLALGIADHGRLRVGTEREHPAGDPQGLEGSAQLGNDLLDAAHRVRVVALVDVEDVHTVGADCRVLQGSKPQGKFMELNVLNLFSRAFWRIK